MPFPKMPSLPDDDGWPTQAFFWLEWGLSYLVGGHVNVGSLTRVCL